MDMHEPATQPQPRAEETLNEATATATAAGINEAADATAGAATDADSLLAEGSEAALEAETLEADAEKTEVHDEALTLESVIAAAQALMAKDPADYNMDDVRRLRQQFSMLHGLAQTDTSTDAPEAEAATADSAGEQTLDIEVQTVEEPSLVRDFNAVVEELRARKTAWTAEQEAIRARNLELKNAIIDKILALADDTDNVNRTFQQYRDLQDEFNAVGEVDPVNTTEVWKRFQDAREKYSDNLKVNKELRDYDFKKNLAEKEALLAEASTLADEEDVIAAYRRLQDLHNRWRRIGPVAKEIREEIWNRFREISADVNKRYQAFFEARKAREAENEAAKTALCERLEALDFTGLSSFAAWDKMTKSILELQAEWKTLGFAAKKLNRQLFARFRNRCDEFFAAKAEYFRTTRDELNRNLAAKQALADEAEALATSTEWRKAGDRFVEMQKEWKAIGAVPKKFSDALWKRFTAACDTFFDARKKAGNGARAAENAALKAKREIIGKLSALAAEDLPRAEAFERLKALQDEWSAAGHVPFREKDKLYEAYRSACDAVRQHFELAERGARRRRFEAAVADIEGDDNKMYRERERLARALENRRAELRTYENNLGFLSSKSKSGDSLLHDMERRIERLKADIAELDEKMRLLDSKLS